MRKGKISIKAIAVLCVIQFTIVALLLLTCYMELWIPIEKIK